MEAIKHFHHQQYDESLSILGKFNHQDVLFQQMKVFVENTSRKAQYQTVYEFPAAFEAFCNNGSNNPLYENTSKQLQNVYKKAHDQLNRKMSILDVGVGAGRALLPAITEDISSISLLEPSSIMLQDCQNAIKPLIDKHAITTKSHNCTIQDYIKSENNNESFDIIEGTFSIQSVAPQDRQNVFEWIRLHSKHFVMVEFNVPQDYSLDTWNPKRYNFIEEVFHKGVDDYKDCDQDLFQLISQGFLMPVLFSYFDENKPRVNYEKPIAGWVQDLVDAGYKESNISITEVYPYWWSTAYLIHATS